MAVLTITKQRLNPETDRWENFIPALGGWVQNADNVAVDNVHIVKYPDINRHTSPEEQNNHEDRDG